MVQSSRALVGVLTLACLASSSPWALAEDCDGVGVEGVCADAQTLQWCANGEFMEASCPKGEICTTHDAFDGGYGCVPVEDSSCGDIGAQGDCTSGGNLVWCSENGELMLEQCSEGTLCSWDIANMGFECLPTDSMMAGSDPSPPAPKDGPGDDGDQAGGADDLDPDAGPGAAGDPEGEAGPGGPTPEVQAGDPRDQSLVSAESELVSGCGAADPAVGDGQLLLVLVALLFLLLGIRRLQVRMPVPIRGLINPSAAGGPWWRKTRPGTRSGRG